jgi:hypothetical protein
LKISTSDAVESRVRILSRFFWDECGSAVSPKAENLKRIARRDVWWMRADDAFQLPRFCSKTARRKYDQPRSCAQALERLEARLDENLGPFFRVEFYEMGENGTLIHLYGRDRGVIEARYNIHVVFVDVADGRPITEQTRNAAPAAMR